MKLSTQFFLKLFAIEKNVSNKTDLLFRVEHVVEVINLVCVLTRLKTTWSSKKEEAKTRPIVCPSVSLSSSWSPLIRVGLEIQTRYPPPDLIATWLTSVYITSRWRSKGTVRSGTTPVGPQGRRETSRKGSRDPLPTSANQLAEDKLSPRNSRTNTRRHERRKELSKLDDYSEDVSLVIHLARSIQPVDRRSRVRREWESLVHLPLVWLSSKQLTRASRADRVARFSDKTTRSGLAKVDSRGKLIGSSQEEHGAFPTLF